MKTIVIILSCLAVAAYAFDAAAFNKYKQDYKTCADELGKSMEPSVELLVCVTQKEGTLLDDTGAMKRGRIMEKFDELIENAENVQKAKDLVSNCFEEAEKNGLTGMEETKSIIACGLPIVSFVK